MFCPVCKCEFREGFTRCAGCNADLVDDLARHESSREQKEVSAPASFVPVREYCGFLDLDEAREARDSLRRHRIAADILIRESPEKNEPDGPVREEYWLRVETARFQAAGPILGFDQSEAASCERCGHEIVAEEGFCPGCGFRFGAS